MNKLVLLSFLLFTKSVYGQYLEVKTIGCSITENEHKKIEKLLAYERMFYNEIFQTDINLTAAVKINLFGKLKDFREVKNSAQVVKQADGFYNTQLNEAYVYKSDDFISVSLHEASHSLFSANSKIAPKWLNEGLAEFFETFDFDANGNLYSYPQAGRLKSIHAGIALNDTTRLKLFFKNNEHSFYKEDATDNYNTAYSIIFYFIKSKNSEGLKAIIRYIKNGKTTEEAIINTYGSFRNFEERYKQFYYFYRIS